MRDILVIRLTAIGDVVMVSPLFRCIKNAYPASRIHFVTHSRMVSFLEGLPYVDRIYGYSLDGNRPVDLPRRFDYISDLQGNRHSRFLMRGIEGPIGVLNKQNVRKWMLVNMRGLFGDCRHRVLEYIEAGPPGVCYDGLGLYLPAMDFDLPEGVPEGDFVSVGMGSAHNTKSIPEEIVAEYIAHSALPVVLLGGEKEVDCGMRLGFRFEGKAFNFCGQTTLRETAKLLSCSRMVISGDTGIMHMAAALNKPMHVVWGSTAASFGMGPLMPDIGSSVVMHHWVGGLFCRPCSKLGYSSCPRGHFRCMREQDSGRWVLL